MDPALGCGRVEWADALDHALGLLEEKPDARVREHLASCDACRGDAGNFLVLADALRAFDRVTRVRGREAFADDTRTDVRSSFGSSRLGGQTAAWRVANTGETQRLRRAEQRRRGNIARALKTAAAVLAAAVAGIAILSWLFGAYVVDRHCEPVESALGVDFAAWGFRPDFETVATRAAAAASVEDVRALARPVERLLAREFVSDARTAESVVLLEFAHAAALKGTPAEAAVLAAAVRAAGDRKGRAGLAEAEALLARGARDLLRAGKPERAKEVLLLSALDGSPLADYYNGILAAEAGDAKASTLKLEAAARKLPVVWAELVWRRLRSGEAGPARAAVARAPAGPLRDALRALVESAGGE